MLSTLVDVIWCHLLYALFFSVAFDLLFSTPTLFSPTQLANISSYSIEMCFGGAYISSEKSLELNSSHANSQLKVHFVHFSKCMIQPPAGNFGSSAPNINYCSVNSYYQLLFVHTKMCWTINPFKSICCCGVKYRLAVFDVRRPVHYVKNQKSFFLWHKINLNVCAYRSIHSVVFIKYGQGKRSQWVQFTQVHALLQSTVAIW